MHLKWEGHKDLLLLRRTMALGDVMVGGIRLLRLFYLLCIAVKTL